MNLTPDYSLIIQVLLFLVVWAGLSRLAFAPTREVLDQRLRRTVAAEREAADLVVSATSDQETYDTTVLQRRQQLAANTAAARTAAQEESSRALSDARDAANRALDAQRAVVAEQIESARTKLSSSAADIAGQMLSRVTEGPTR